MLKDNELGRSMVEMLGVLSVVGVLSTTGVIAFNNGMHKQKASATIQQMSTIVRNMHELKYASNRRQAYASFGSNAEAAIPDIAITRGIIPEEMIIEVNGKKQLKNAYKGNVYIESSNDGKGFSVIFKGLPKDVAVTMATTDWSIGDGGPAPKVTVKSGD